MAEMSKSSHAQSVQMDFTGVLPPVRRIWVQAAGAVLAQFGLPTSLGMAVILINRAGKGGARQSALAEEVGVNPGAMVRILDQGESAGLLERRDSREDRRIKTVHILPKGEDLAREMEQAIAQLRSVILADIPLDELVMATRILRAFERRVGEYLQQGRGGR